eukprot:g8920.t1
MERADSGRKAHQGIPVPPFANNSYFIVFGRIEENAVDGGISFGICGLEGRGTSSYISLSNFRQERSKSLRNRRVFACRNRPLCFSIRTTEKTVMERTVDSVSQKSQVTPSKDITEEVAKLKISQENKPQEQKLRNEKIEQEFVTPARGPEITTPSRRGSADSQAASVNFPSRRSTVSDMATTPDNLSDTGSPPNSQTGAEEGAEQSPTSRKKQGKPKPMRNKRNSKNGTAHKHGFPAKTHEFRPASEYKFKTKLCEQHLKTRTCIKGDDCQYAHGHLELMPKRYDTLYKSVPCDAHFKNGKCEFGDRCRFIHDDVRYEVSDSEFLLYSPSMGQTRVEFVHDDKRRSFLRRLIQEQNNQWKEYNQRRRKGFRETPRQTPNKSQAALPKESKPSPHDPQNVVFHRKVNGNRNKKKKKGGRRRGSVFDEAAVGAGRFQEQMAPLEPIYMPPYQEDFFAPFLPMTGPVPGGPMGAPPPLYYDVGFQGAMPMPGPSSPFNSQNVSFFPPPYGHPQMMPWGNPLQPVYAVPPSGFGQYMSSEYVRGSAPPLLPNQFMGSSALSSDYIPGPPPYFPAQQYQQGFSFGPEGGPPPIFAPQAPQPLPPFLGPLSTQHDMSRDQYEAQEPEWTD